MLAGVVGGTARWQNIVREESMLDVKEKLEGGVKDSVNISHPSGQENGNIIMENRGEDKKSGNVHQAGGMPKYSL